MTGERRGRFDLLWDEHYGRLLAFALRRVPADQAEDVVGETFLAAWRRLEDVPDDALPWLYRTCLGAIANRRRGLRRSLALRARLASQPPPVVPDPSERMGDPALLAALRTLSSTDREVLLLTYWEDLAPAAAAAVLGCSPRALTVRLNRAHNRLRDRLAGEDPQPAALAGGHPAKEEP